MQEKEGRRISMLLSDKNFGRSLTCEQIVVKNHFDEDIVDEKSKEKKTAAQWQRCLTSEQLVQDPAAAWWENVNETVCDRMK